MPLDLTNLIVRPTLAADRHGAGEAFAKAAARISSGRRITMAADDAAGLAISDRLSRDYAVAAQAIRNASDGLSAVRIADTGLGQVTAITQRMAELATRAASGLLDDAQRGAVAAEFDALKAEVDRIAATTSFNGQPLLQGGAPVSVHVGLDGSADATVAIPTTDASTTALGIDGASVETADDARAALDALAAADARVAQARSTYAAGESRLVNAVTQLARGAEQSAAAASRIVDADFARETAELVRGRIMQSAQVAMLSQSNRMAGMILDLLA